MRRHVEVLSQLALPHPPALRRVEARVGAVGGRAAQKVGPGWLLVLELLGAPSVRKLRLEALPILRVQRAATNAAGGMRRGESLVASAGARSRRHAGSGAV